MSPSPLPSRQTVIAAAQILKALGHSGFDLLLLEMGLPNREAGRGSGLKSRSTSLASYAVDNPQVVTAEGVEIGTAIVTRAAIEFDRYNSGPMPNVTADECTRFYDALVRDGCLLSDEPKLILQEHVDGNGQMQNDIDDEAENAVLDAIEHLVVGGKRAFVHSVPTAAVNLLRQRGRGSIGDAEASSRIKEAITAMSGRGDIDVFAEPWKTWLIKTKKTTNMTQSPNQKELGKRIFIVHGHDEAPREAVARFLEKLDYEPIILHEQANRGRTIISKFRDEAADAVFAVVLMTPDDHGGIAGKATAPRARQNVVLELGFFLGVLGPERVAALVKGSLEHPSDYDGVVYISLDDNGGWRAKLCKELEAAGLPVDWSKLAS